MGAELFLKTLFHNKPDDAYILIWKKYLPDTNGQELKQSAWFKSTQDAISYCQNGNGQPADLYVGCGVSPKNFGPNRRCLASEISGIPAIWLDIDILDPAHKKPNLPETEEQARTLIDSFPLQPTMIVHSGHGYQCWWVFDKFVSFAKTEMRTNTSEFVHKFVWSMRDQARAMNYDLDMTFDLSRVMRIPGSQNLKNIKAPKPVKIVEIKQEFYAPKLMAKKLDEFITSLGDKATPIIPAAARTTCSSIVQGLQLTLDPNAEPPKDKFDMLYTVDSKFKAGWEKNRRDLGDQSPSAYDLSLATLALLAEWTPQETVNLLIAWRRKYGFDLKLREDYYLRTLSIANNVFATRDAIRQLEAIAQEAELSGKKYTPDMIQTAKDKASELLKTRIINVFQYPFDPIEYKLETAQGCIHLGTIQNLSEQQFFRRKFADATKILLPKMKESDWHVIASALLQSCITVKISDDTDSKGIFKVWLIKYLQYTEALYDRHECVLFRKPFFEDKYLYLFLDSLQEFIAVHCKERKNPKEMGLLLTEFGFKPTSTNFKDPNIEGKYLSRNVWYLPLAKDMDVNNFADHAMLEEQQRLWLERKNERLGRKVDPDDY